MTKIITIINNKGGTGKTTTTLNLGAALARKKQKVLFIDLDGQSNLTSSLGISGTKHHLGEVLLNGTQLQDVMIEKDPNSFVIPSNDKIIDYENQLNNEPGREYLLKEALEKVKNDFDFVLIDCAPNLGIFATNSLVAADYFIVPMQAENFAFIGLDRILQVTEKVKKRLNPQLELAGILFVRLSQKTRFSQAVISNISQNVKFEDKLFNSYIRQDISLMESAAFGQSVFEYAPNSRGAEDFKNLANEIMKKYGKK
jgi:chromosome partitioning protein